MKGQEEERKRKKGGKEGVGERRKKGRVQKRARNK